MNLFSNMLKTGNKNNIDGNSYTSSTIVVWSVLAVGTLMFGAKKTAPSGQAQGPIPSPPEQKKTISKKDLAAAQPPTGVQETLAQETIWPDAKERFRAQDALQSVRQGEMVLKHGSDHYEAVGALQSLLRHAHKIGAISLPKPLKKDKDYRGDTKDAVEIFQKGHCTALTDQDGKPLYKLGEVGAHTLRELEEIVLKHPTKSIWDRLNPFKAAAPKKDTPEEKEKPKPEKKPPPKPQPKIATNKTYYEMVPVLLQFEGGVNSDPDDSGNAGGNVTNMGVTQAAYNVYRDRHKLKRQSTLKMTKAEALNVYKEGYWNKAKCHQLPTKVAAYHFDTAVNMGVDRAIRILQKVSGAGVDGKFGGGTREKVYAMDPAALLKAYNAERNRLYKAIALKGNNKKYLKGWLNRTEDLMAHLGAGGKLADLSSVHMHRDYGPPLSQVLSDIQQRAGLTVTGELDQDTLDLLE